VPRLDPGALRPAELARLLNSTCLGEAARAHTIYRQRNRAGYRIGDGRTIDLVRYVSWLARRWHEWEPAEGTDGYRGRERARPRAQRPAQRRRAFEANWHGERLIQDLLFARES